MGRFVPEISAEEIRRIGDCTSNELFLKRRDVLVDEIIKRAAATGRKQMIIKLPGEYIGTMIVPGIIDELERRGYRTVFDRSDLTDQRVYPNSIHLFW